MKIQNKMALGLILLPMLFVGCADDEGCIDLLSVARTNQSAPVEQEVAYSSIYEDGVTTVRMEWEPPERRSRLQDIELGFKAPSTPVADCGPYTMKRVHEFIEFYQVFDGAGRLVFEGGHLPTDNTVAESGEYSIQTGPICAENNWTDGDPQRGNIVEHNGTAVPPGKSIAVEVDGRDYRLYNLGTNSWAALIPGEWAGACE